MNNVSEAVVRPRARKLRRVIQVGALAVGLSVFLAACSTSGQNESSDKVGGTLNLWYSPPTSGSAAKGAATYKKFNVDPFVALNPDVAVNATPQDVSTINQKIQVALAAGNGPDIVPTPGSSVAVPYGAAGYLADLTKAAEKDGWKDKVLPWALDMGYIDGKLQAVPTSYQTLVLYYNKTLFEKNGWTPPTNKAELEKLAGQMQAKGIIPFAAGNASYQPETEWLVSAFMNEVAGPSKVYDALTGKISWTDPSLKASITLLKDYFDKGYFQGGLKQYFSTQDPQKYAQLAAGTSGMLISGSWELDALPSYFGVDGNTSDWDWAPLPSLGKGVPNDIYPLSVGNTVSVNAKSKNIKTSEAYINWLFSDTKNMWKSAVATGSQPLPIKYTDADVPSGIDKRYAAQYKALNEASESGNVGYTTWTSFGAKADQYIIQNIDKVLSGDVTIDAFMAGTDKAFKADKAAGLIPTVFKTGS